MNSAIISNFKEFCEVDLQLAKRTVGGHICLIRNFLDIVCKDLNQIEADDIREYLSDLKKRFEPKTYANNLCALKRFFRDFLKRGNLVESFRFPTIAGGVIIIPTKTELQRFFYGLPTNRDKAMFLFYATSGLRRKEILSLKHEDVDFKRRMLMPSKTHETNTIKKSYISFYNEEAEQYLKAYLEDRGTDDDPRIFKINEKNVRKAWRKAYLKSGIYITPQVLRNWFAEEMGNLGVADRYIDAFCGRTPKTVLARHYSDYSPEKMRARYLKANLKVLS